MSFKVLTKRIHPLLSKIERLVVAEIKSTINDGKSSVDKLRQSGSDLVSWVGTRIQAKIGGPFGETRSSFPPMSVLLQREGQPYRLVIERVSLEIEKGVATGELLRELTAYEAAMPVGGEPFVLFIKDTFNSVVGFSGSTLLTCGQFTYMKGDRDRKFDTAIQDMGVVMLLAKLHFMKSQGFWKPRSTVISECDPHVMNSYRKKCGIPVLDPFGYGLDSVTQEEGDAFLSCSPYTLTPVS